MTQDQACSPENSKRGFVLPAALLALTVLTVVTTAGFFSVQQEAKIGNAAGRATQAFYLAEIGINEVLGDWESVAANTLPQWGTHSVADTTPLGIWTVTVTRANDQLYYLSSEGSTTAGLLQGGATRELGLAARVTLPAFEPRAAATTTVSTNVNGTVEIDGRDKVPAGWGSRCTLPLLDKSGVLMADTTAVATSGPASITGNPSLTEDPYVGSGTLQQFGDLSWSDLTGVASKIYSGGTLGQFFPQVASNGSCDVGHSQNWGDPLNPTAPCGGHFPVIHIQGDAILQPGTRGQGILLVDGKLKAQGDFVFNGMIVAQDGYQTTGSDNHIIGALKTTTVDLSQGSTIGSSSIDYSSCAVREAVHRSADLNRARPLGERGWVDVSVLGGN